MKLSNLIRNKRISKGLTQVELAHALGVPQSYISKWESNTVPNGKYIFLLMSQLDITDEELKEVL